MYRYTDFHDVVHLAHARRITEAEACCLTFSKINPCPSQLDTRSADLTLSNDVRPRYRRTGNVLILVLCADSLNLVGVGWITKCTVYMNFTGGGETDEVGYHGAAIKFGIAVKVNF